MGKIKFLRDVMIVRGMHVNTPIDPRFQRTFDVRVTHRVLCPQDLYLVFKYLMHTGPMKKKGGGGATSDKWILKHNEHYVM